MIVFPVPEIAVETLPEPVIPRVSPAEVLLKVEISEPFTFVVPS